MAGTILGSFLVAVPIVLLLPDLWRDRRIRIPLICVAVALAGSIVEIRFYEHYFAPAAAALLIVAVQALRHLRQWKYNRQPVGRFLTRAIPILVLGAVVVSRGSLLLRQQEETPLVANSQRDVLAAAIDDPLDKHVIIVRYTGHQSPHEEWVYNGADIDAQNVIWAHDLGSDGNAPLIEYYKGRKFWLLQPDINPTRLDPYP